MVPSWGCSNLTTRAVGTGRQGPWSRTGWGIHIGRMALPSRTGTRHHETVDDDTARAELDELDRDECFRLLASVPVGRIAVCGPGQAPLVVPVNFALDGDVIVFRTDE